MGISFAENEFIRKTQGNIDIYGRITILRAYLVPVVKLWKRLLL